MSKNMLKYLRLITVFILISVMILALASCSSDSKETVKKDSENINTEGPQNNASIYPDDFKPLKDKAKYTFMVFEVGTDLESTELSDGSLQGCISNDLKEMMEVGSSDSLNILVETGGTKKWAIDKISNTENQRWLMKKGDMELIKPDLGNRNMGDPAALQNFIIWGIKSYPAEKYVLVLGDHGGGITGFGVDELNNSDGLTLDEIQKAMKDAYSITGQKLEIIGFDACLMATLETAHLASSYGKYFVASEETEPGHGWYYTPIMNAIIENPDIDGKDLGKVICDGFKAQGVEWEDADQCTLSVIDLSKVSDVVNAFNTFIDKAGAEIEEPERFSKLAEARSKSEDYGNSGGAHGDSTDQVDIGDLAKKAKDMYQSESDNLLQKLNEAVVYKLPGCASKPDVTGLSIYLPFKDKEGLSDKMGLYEKIDFSPNYKSFLKKYSSKLYSDTTPVQFDDKSPEEEQASDSRTTIASLNDFSLAAEDERFTVQIKKEDIEQVDQVYSVLGRYAENSTSKVLFLGMDSDVDFDENTGTIKDNFTGGWVTLGDQFVSMFLEDENEDYSLYNIPVKLNGVEVDIKVLYNYKTEKEEILGAWKGIDEKTGMADKNIIKIKKGDKIKPLYYSYDYNTDKDGNEEGMEFVVGDKFDLGFEELPTGNYLYGFYIVDMAQNESYSDFCDISISTGSIKSSEVASIK